MIEYEAFILSLVFVAVLIALTIGGLLVWVVRSIKRKVQAREREREKVFVKQEKEGQ